MATKSEVKKPVASAAPKIRKPRVSDVPANEGKDAKFIRLAKKRVSKAIGAIRNIGKLATSGYVFTAPQVAKISAALSDEVSTVSKKFAARLAGGGEKASGPVFDL